MESSTKKFILQFGINLKTIRQQKNVTQAMLANDSNIEISQISRIERGVQNTSIGTAYIIAEALDVHITVLFNFDEVK